MSRTSFSDVLAAAAIGAAAGAVGSFVKSKIEPPLQDAAEAVVPPSHAEKERPGADIQGHPDRMPPAQLAQAVTHRRLSREEKLQAQQGIHYAFGAGFGVVYGALAEAVPAASFGFGVPAALALWVGAHLTALPALGLSATPQKLPASTHLWEAGSHVGFGIATEATRRVLRRALRLG